MAKEHRDQLRAQVRQLERYTEADLSDSAVHHLAELAVKASEDKSTAAKIVKVFSETVAAVPPPDRIKFLYAVIGGLTLIILSGMALKAFGLW
jgi:DNA-directed RNA polymerase specialized sigma24 family protein